jgi:hypothetical protein
LRLRDPRVRDDQDDPTTIRMMGTTPGATSSVRARRSGHTSPVDRGRHATTSRSAG